MDRIKIIILALTLTLVGCKKENEPIKTNEVNCNCGNIELVNFYTNTSTNQRTYVYNSRNNCTSNVYQFETNNEYTDSRFCLTYQW